MHYDLTGTSAILGIQLLVLIVFLLLLILLLPAIIVAGLIRRRIEKNLNYKVSTVITQYNPPHDLSPAEVGFLYDMRCGKNEILATLFDLSQREIVNILSSRKVEVIDEAAYKDLLEYEKIAIRIYNGDTKDLEAPRTVPFTYSIDGTENTINLRVPSKKSTMSFTKAVQISLNNKGIKTRNYSASLLLRVFYISIVVGFLPILLAGNGGRYNGAQYEAWSAESFVTAFFLVLALWLVLFPVYIFVSWLFVFIWTIIAGRYWLNTKTARKIWPELEGYRLFLTQVDADRIKFESTDIANEYITKTLPYAIVFNLDTKWRARIKNMNTKH